MSTEENSQTPKKRPVPQPPEHLPQPDKYIPRIHPKKQPESTEALIRTTDDLKPPSEQPAESPKEPPSEVPPSTPSPPPTPPSPWAQLGIGSKIVLVILVIAAAYAIIPPFLYQMTGLSGTADESCQRITSPGYTSCGYCAETHQCTACSGECAIALGTDSGTFCGMHCCPAGYHYYFPGQGCYKEPLGSQESQSTSPSTRQSQTTGGITGIYKGSGVAYWWTSGDRIHPLLYKERWGRYSVTADLKQSGNTVYGTIYLTPIESSAPQLFLDDTEPLTGTVNSAGAITLSARSELTSVIWDFNIVDSNTLSGSWLIFPFMLDGVPQSGTYSYPNSFVLKKQ